jgi:hypothetical protein
MRGCWNCTEDSLRGRIAGGPRLPPAGGCSHRVDTIRPTNRRFAIAHQDGVPGGLGYVREATEHLCAGPKSARESGHSGSRGHQACASSSGGGEQRWGTHAAAGLTDCSITQNGWLSLEPKPPAPDPPAVSGRGQKGASGTAFLFIAMALHRVVASASLGEASAPRQPAAACRPHMQLHERTSYYPIMRRPQAPAAAPSQAHSSPPLMRRMHPHRALAAEVDTPGADSALVVPAAAPHCWWEVPYPCNRPSTPVALHLVQAP